MGIGTLLVGTGTVLNYQENKAASKVEAKRAEEQKVLNEVAAGQAVATSQRAALEEGRQAKLMASRALAIAAAGGGAENANRAITNIMGEGRYRSMIAMYEGEMQAEKLKTEGEIAEREGMAKSKAYKKRGQTSLISGFGSMYEATR